MKIDLNLYIRKLPDSPEYFIDYDSSCAYVDCVIDNEEYYKNDCENVLNSVKIDLSKLRIEEIESL